MVVDTALVVRTLPKLDKLGAVWLAWADGVQGIHIALGGWKLLSQKTRVGQAPGCADSLLHVKPNIVLCWGPRRTGLHEQLEAGISLELSQQVFGRDPGCFRCILQSHLDVAKAVVGPACCQGQLVHKPLLASILIKHQPRCCLYNVELVFKRVVCSHGLFQSVHISWSGPSPSAVQVWVLSTARYCFAFGSEGKVRRNKGINN